MNKVSLDSVRTASHQCENQRPATCRWHAIEPVGGYWAVVSELWMLSQSAKRAFGCHGRRCFAKQRVSDHGPDMLLPCFAPSIAMAPTAWLWIGMLLPSRQTELQKPCQLRRGKLRRSSVLGDVSSPKNSGQHPSCRTRQTRQHVSIGRHLISNQEAPVREMPRCVETFFGFGTVHAT